MTATSSRVGVVTVTYNSAPVLDEFLTSLESQVDVDFRIYAIDNDSHDDSVTMLDAAIDRLPLTITPNDDNLGVAEGNNQGILQALADGAEWVLLLNNDTVFGPRLIADLVDTATSDHLDILTPLIAGIDPAGTVWFRQGTMPVLRGYLAQHVDRGAPMSGVPRGRVEKIDYAPTCALLIHRRVFERIGLMDPVYFVYFDDVDFALRAKRAGFDYWVTTDVELLHKASTLTGGAESEFSVRWMSRNWPLITRRQAGPASRAVALGYIQAWMLARVALRMDTPARYRARQRWFREGLRAGRTAPPAPRLDPSPAGDGRR
jgi:GT2 family glycosyltransferase